MYSTESLSKYSNLINQAIDFFKDNTPEHVVLSRGNVKIGRVLNVSTAALKTCGNCSGCCFYCYDIKASLQYQNVLNARAKNTVLAITNRDKFFSDIDQAMTRRRTNKYFRFHVAGDIIDNDYFKRMIETAKNHPDFIIWTYTKQYKIVNDYCNKYDKQSIPENLHIMFSEWRGMQLVNPYNFPEFRVVFKGETPPEGFYCPGNCDVCKQLNRGCLAGETTYCHEH